MHRQNAPPIISGINTATDTKVKTMDDSEQIRNVIQLYIDSMNESNPDKVKQAFHGNAKVVGYLNGDFMEMSVDDFASFVESQQPSPKEKGEDVVFEILSLEKEGTTALVKIRDKYLGITFLDTLSFIKFEGEWRLYNKLFNVEN
jgi:hypothetical protein